MGKSVSLVWSGLYALTTSTATYTKVSTTQPWNFLEDLRTQAQTATSPKKRDRTRTLNGRSPNAARDSGSGR